MSIGCGEVHMSTGWDEKLWFLEVKQVKFNCALKLSKS